jgi:hypothetical protein
MCLISSDLIQQHKARGMSGDCIQRLLGGIGEFVKTWVEVSRDENDDYSAQLFSIWKHVLQSVELRHGESIAIIFSFLLHLEVTFGFKIYE